MVNDPGSWRSRFLGLAIDVKLFVKRVDKVLCKLAEDGENKEVLSRKTKELMM